MTTSTSTTTLPADKITRLRPELNTLLSVLIKQNRSSLKSQHYIDISQTAIDQRTPPRGNCFYGPTSNTNSMTNRNPNNGVISIENTTYRKIIIFGQLIGNQSTDKWKKIHGIHII